MTYAEAAETFAKARDKRLGYRLPGRAGNTRLVRSSFSPGAYAIKLYATEVVTIHPDGTYTLRTGGWPTQTTFARMTVYTSAACGKRQGVPAVSCMDGAEYELTEGFRVRLRDTKAPLGGCVPVDKCEPIALWDRQPYESTHRNRWALRDKDGWALREAGLSAPGKRRRLLVAKRQTLKVAQDFVRGGEAYLWERARG